MIAILLTLLCLYIAYVGSDNGATMWIMFGVIALIWFMRMVWIDDARAQNNFTDYWADDDRRRRR